ncbi:uncharacterized protein LOC127367656 [Dicentrarchus labrax]|uniref:uncharacterized protein LOC127367656 n=1 Tax=Dicentrarchus labrax TaxID=13489 RepID=UPI0021F65D39|nr:uncharacterized protein LOC127367656 [Dicentrarchus labrax]
MSAVLGRMTTTTMMMMVWVWISLLTLARFNTAQDQHRDAELTALLEETGSGGRLSPVPVWKFLNERRDGGEASHFGRAQYLCSGSSLSVRFSLIRHTDLRLADGRRLLTDGCQGSVRNLGPWMLLTLPYTSCHLALWVSNGTWFRQLRLRYFDHLLQANVTGLATCENPATSLQLMPPLVTCRTTDVTVKLPLGTSGRPWWWSPWGSSSGHQTCQPVVGRPWWWSSSWRPWCCWWWSSSPGRPWCCWWSLSSLGRKWWGWWWSSSSGRKWWWSSSRKWWWCCWYWW